jgi:pimeloyl-ACP methyl ester carboxylesterase
MFTGDVQSAFTPSSHAVHCHAHCSKVYVADEVADTVIGILDKLGVKEACVVGHSYGAPHTAPACRR